MRSSDPRTFTALLDDVGAGRQESVDALMPVIYHELRRRAARYLRRERGGHTLQTTALVHEAYLRLAGTEEVRWESRAHFFAIAAQAMRRILVDHARHRRRAKRGGDGERVSLDQADVAAAEHGVDLLALDQALARLAAVDPQQARVVELRFFGGLSVEEAATVLGVSASTVKRDWAMARAWLRYELRDRRDA